MNSTLTNLPDSTSVVYPLFAKAFRSLHSLLLVLAAILFFHANSSAQVKTKNVLTDAKTLSSSESSAPLSDSPDSPTDDALQQCRKFIHSNNNHSDNNHYNYDTVLISDEKILIPAQISVHDFYFEPLNEKQIMLIFNSLNSNSLSKTQANISPAFLNQFYHLITKNVSTFSLRNRITLLSQLDEIRFQGPGIYEEKMEALNAILETLDFGNPHLRLYFRPMETIINHLEKVTIKKKSRLIEYVSRRLLYEDEETYLILGGLKRYTLIALSRHFATGLLPYTDDHLISLFQTLSKSNAAGIKLLNFYSVKELGSLLFNLNKMDVSIPTTLIDDIQESIIFDISKGQRSKLALSTAKSLSFIITELFRKGRRYSPEFMGTFLDFFLEQDPNGQIYLDLISDRDLAYLFISISFLRIDVPHRVFSRLVDAVLFRKSSSNPPRIHFFMERNFFETLNAIVSSPHQLTPGQQEAFIHELKLRLHNGEFLESPSAYGPKVAKIFRSLSHLKVNIDETILAKMESMFINGRQSSDEKEGFYCGSDLLCLLESTVSAHYKTSDKFATIWKQKFHTAIEQKDLYTNLDHITSYFHTASQKEYQAFYDPIIVEALLDRAEVLLQTKPSRNNFQVPVSSLSLFFTSLSKLPAVSLSPSLVESWLRYTLSEDEDHKKIISQFEPKKLGSSLVHLSMAITSSRYSSPLINEWINAWLAEALTEFNHHPKVYYFDNQRFVNSSNALTLLRYPNTEKLARDWFPQILQPSADGAHRIDTFNEQDLAGLIVSFSRINLAPPEAILEKWYEVFTATHPDGAFQLNNFTLNEFHLISSSLHNLDLRVPAHALQRMADFVLANSQPEANFEDFKYLTGSILYLSNHLVSLNKNLETHLISNFYLHKDHYGINHTDLRSLLRIFSLQGFTVNETFYESLVSSIRNLGVDSFDDAGYLFVLHQLLLSGPSYSMKFYHTFKTHIEKALANPQIKTEALHAYYLFHQYQTLIEHQSLPKLPAALIEGIFEAQKADFSNSLQPMTAFQAVVSSDLSKRYLTTTLTNEHFIGETASFVDLYSPEHHLIIQIDGIHHFLKDHALSQFEMRSKDMILDKILSQSGYRVFRIPYYLWNDPEEKQKLLTQLDAIISPPDAAPEAATSEAR